jgi:hypothetical protein
VFWIVADGHAKEMLLNNLQAKRVLAPRPKSHLISLFLALWDTFRPIMRAGLRDLITSAQQLTCTPWKNSPATARLCTRTEGNRLAFEM